ncbi:MAG TPA: hypothetical protein VLA56_19140 [Pseudomonadales bacterium]|nr:hypothetical protein [Pseudomonadales bacterium]
MKGFAGLALVLATMALAGCMSSPPEQAADLCRIFEEKGGWYRDARRSEKRWGVPISVMMAMTFQESSYNARARPARQKLLWVIPWTRPSSAYGYAQATNEAWRDYTRSTGRGGADRNDFGDAMDFVGWYNDRSAKMLGLRKDDAYSLYLAYHDGPTGFKRGTWKKKAWLKEAAQKVNRRAAAYEAQLVRCRDDLEGPWWWPF